MQIRAVESSWFLFREYLLFLTAANPRYHRYKSPSPNATKYLSKQRLFSFTSKSENVFSFV